MGKEIPTPQQQTAPPLERETPTAKTGTEVQPHGNAAAAQQLDGADVPSDTPILDAATSLLEAIAPELSKSTGGAIDGMTHALHQIDSDKHKTHREEGLALVRAVLPQMTLADDELCKVPASSPARAEHERRQQAVTDAFYAHPLRAGGNYNTHVAQVGLDVVVNTNAMQTNSVSDLISWLTFAFGAEDPMATAERLMDLAQASTGVMDAGANLAFMNAYEDLSRGTALYVNHVLQDVVPDYMERFVVDREIRAEEEHDAAMAGRGVVSEDAMSAKANRIASALSGFTEDEDAVLDELRGLTRAEVKALRIAYQQNTGRSLDSDLTAFLDDEDMAEANAYLTGRTVDGVLAGMDNALDWYNDNEDKIDELLLSLTPRQSEELMRRLREYPDVFAKVQRVRMELQGWVDDYDVHAFDRGIQGDKDGMHGVRLAEDMNARWYKPNTWGNSTDEGAETFTAMDGEQRKRVAASTDGYLERTEGTDLSTEIDDAYDGAEQQMMTAGVTGDDATMHGHRIAALLDESWVDDDRVYDALLAARPYASRVDAVAKANHGASVRGLLARQYGDGDGYIVMYGVWKDGKPPLHVAVHWMVDGVGTRTWLQGRTLDRASKEDILQATLDYRRTYGEEMRDALDGDLDGDAWFEAELQLDYGADRSAADQLAIARRRQEHADSGLGNTFLDLTEVLRLQHASSNYDHSVERLEALFNEDGTLKDGVTEADVARWAETNASAFQGQQQARDAVANAIVTGVEITAAAVLTVLTEGAASPWLVAAVCGAAGIATEKAVRGSSMGGEEVAGKAIAVGVGVGLSKLNSLPGIKAGFAHVESVFGGKATGALARSIAEGGLDEAITSAAGSLANVDLLHQGIEVYLGTAGLEAAKGLGTGAVKSGVGHVASGGGTLENADLFDTAASNTAGAAMDPNTWTGDLDDAIAAGARVVSDVAKDLSAGEASRGYGPAQLVVPGTSLLVGDRIDQDFAPPGTVLVMRGLKSHRTASGARATPDHPEVVEHQARSVYKGGQWVQESDARLERHIEAHGAQAMADAHVASSSGDIDGYDKRTSSMISTTQSASEARKYGKAFLFVYAVPKSKLVTATDVEDVFMGASLDPYVIGTLDAAGRLQPLGGTQP